MEPARHVAIRTHATHPDCGIHGCLRRLVSGCLGFAFAVLGGARDSFQADLALRMAGGNFPAPSCGRHCVRLRLHKIARTNSGKLDLAHHARPTQCSANHDLGFQREFKSLSAIARADRKRADKPDRLARLAGSRSARLERLKLYRRDKSDSHAPRLDGFECRRRWTGRGRDGQHFARSFQLRVLVRPERQFRDRLSQTKTRHFLANTSRSCAGCRF